MSAEIAIKLPPIPASVTIEGAWVAERDAIISISSAFLSIPNNATFTEATNALARITKHSNALEAQRKVLAQPFNDAASFIKQAADNARKALEDEKTRLKKLLGDYAEAERKRVDEERREAERKHREAIEAQVAANQAADDLGLPPAAPIVEPPPTYIAPAATSSAARVVERVEWEIVNVDDVPRAFCMVDDRLVNAYKRDNGEAIKQHIKAGNGTGLIPGIKFVIRTDVAAR